MFQKTALKTEALVNWARKRRPKVRRYGYGLPCDCRGVRRDYHVPGKQQKFYRPLVRIEQDLVTCVQCGKSWRLERTLRKKIVQLWYWLEKMRTKDLDSRRYEGVLTLPNDIISIPCGCNPTTKRRTGAGPFMTKMTDEGLIHIDCGEIIAKRDWTPLG